MISSMFGKISFAGKKCIIIDVFGISYWINTKEDHNFVVDYQISKKIYCHSISQFINNQITNEIYGFETIKEKEWFKKLLNCQGVGAKTAINILGNDIEKVQKLIKENNLKELSSLKGINKKIANNLISHEWNPNDFRTYEKNNIDNENAENNINEIIATLKSLGYEETQINKCLNKISLKSDSDISDIVSEAIKTIAAQQENEHNKA